MIYQEHNGMEHPEPAPTEGQARIQQYGKLLEIRFKAGTTDMWIQMDADAVRLALSPACCSHETDVLVHAVRGMEEVPAYNPPISRR